MAGVRQCGMKNNRTLNEKQIPQIIEKNKPYRDLRRFYQQKSQQTKNLETATFHNSQSGSVQAECRKPSLESGEMAGS